MTAPSYVKAINDIDAFRKHLAETFEENHQKALAEFGPAIEIDVDDVKFWRFTGMVDISTSLSLVALDLSDLVDVIYEGKLCGSAVLRYEGPWLMADCVVDAAIPARLDFENGESLYLLPVMGANQMQIVHNRPYDYIEPITKTP